MAFKPIEKTDLQKFTVDESDKPKHHYYNPYDNFGKCLKQLKPSSIYPENLNPNELKITRTCDAGTFFRSVKTN